MHDLPGARRVAGLLTMALLAGCGGGSGGDESTRTTISTNAITFGATITDAAKPVSQVFTATFGSDIAHLAVVHSGNAVTNVTSTLNGRTATITVEPAAPATLGPGAFIGAIAVTGYTCADTTCSKLAAGTTSTVAVSYQVSPIVQLVGPYLGTAGVAEDVAIRGIGFGSFNVTGVQFGDTAATTFALVANTTTDIRATHPALAAGTYPVRLISTNHQGPIPTTATLVVVDPTTYAATTLAYPAPIGAVRRLIYDAERRALLVVNDAAAGSLFRYQYSGTAWSAPTSVVVGLNDAALSAKGTTLYGITPTGFVPLDPVTMALGTSIAAPSLPADAFLKNIVVGNDDIALITTGRTANSTATNPYAYSPTTNTVAAASGAAYNNATPAMAANGTIAYLTQSDSTFTTDVAVGRYVVNSNSFSSSTAVLARQNAVLPAMSRNANRLVINGAKVYDATEGLLGLLPATTAAVALKPDDTRLYAYDPTLGGIVTYDVSLGRGGAEYPALGAVTPLAGDPGSNVQMTISPDGRTLFLAGTTQVVVQPTPAQ